MSSKTYTYSETTEEKNRPHDEPTIVVNTVTMEQRNPGGVYITHFTQEKTFPSGFHGRLEWTFDDLHMCIQTKEGAFWDEGEYVKVVGDRLEHHGLFHSFHKMSVEFLRRAAQSFRDNAYMPEVTTQEETSSPSEEDVTEPATRGRGRPRIYTDDEKRSKHREQALKSYYRRKALKEHLREPVNGDEVSFPFMVSSNVLGDFYEEVTFKRTNGAYRKKRE